MNATARARLYGSALIASAGLFAACANTSHATRDTDREHTVMPGDNGYKIGQHQTENTPPAPATPPAQMAEEDLARATRDADGNQPGRVKDVGDGFLVLDPYQQASGESRLTLDAQVPVIQGTGEVTTRALRPGVDVRVFYKYPPLEHHGETPKVVAVQILDPEEAKRVEQEERAIPQGE